MTLAAAAPNSTMGREEALKVVSDFLGPKFRLEQNYNLWLQVFFRKWISNKFGNLVPFAAHHKLYWDWLWAIKVGVKPAPFVGIWPRGGAKSTSAELGVVALAARGVRKYCLYISGTQEQADDHLSNIGALLEYPDFGKGYPAHSSKLLNKYGSSKGWRRNRLRTAGGFTADAIGLDTAARGVKLENLRPDVIVLDDIDEETDSPAATDKKITVLTRKLLPTGEKDCVVICIQNKVIPNGIFSRLSVSPGTTIENVKGADFLQDRIISGPIPAIVDPQVVQTNGKYKLVSGEPSWVGQDLETCNAQIGEWGYTSWLIEAQHDVDTPVDGLFTHIDFERIHVLPDDVPQLVRAVVWVDPAVTATDRSDNHGLQADGLGVDQFIYRLRSWEGVSTPTASLERAITWALELGADHVGVETDQGGDLWQTAYNAVWDEMVKQRKVHIHLTSAMLASLADGRKSWPELDDVEYSNRVNSLRPAFRAEKAGAGYGPKAHRASRMLVDYDNGNVFRHVLGTHDILERALKRFPVRKPYDLTDACFWAWNDLRQGSDNGVGGSSDPPNPVGVHSQPERPPQSQTPLGLAGRVGRLWAGHTASTQGVSPRRMWTER